jgi:hypothetical protein
VLSRARKITIGQYKSSPSPRCRPLLVSSLFIYPPPLTTVTTHSSINLIPYSNQLSTFSPLSSKSLEMPPKGAAEKKPAAAKAPAQKAPAEKKDAGKKTAPTGDKKKRTKTRKETYSSYIYKGMISSLHFSFALAFQSGYRVKAAAFTLTNFGNQTTSKL